ncbi:MAG: SDR family oxidoreductase [Saonia sp.]
MILVTGGTGLLGAHLLLHLLEKEKQIKAIHRANSDLQRVKKVFSYYTEKAEELFKKIQWISADINDIPALQLAFENVTYVYHCAALISFDPKDYERMLKINVEGTSNIVNLCISRNIGKLCYVSSIAAIGKSKNTAEVTEENEWNGLEANVYALTKHEAEIEVWRGIQEGLNAVIINPGVILGPGFWDTGSGLLFKKAAGAPKYYPPSGSGFITVNDVVQLMVGLMESGIKDERFIAVSQNLTYKEILSRIVGEFGKSAPKKELKFWHLEMLWRLDWFWSSLTNKKRRLTKITVTSLKNRQIYCNKKITDKLQFEYEPLAATIKYTCNRFKEENP